ncbi:MAG: hypothetical protein ACOVPA_19725, partial [Rubrivivax sp.]
PVLVVVEGQLPGASLFARASDGGRVGLPHGTSSSMGTMTSLPVAELGSAFGQPILFAAPRQTV